jgi:hypothetical protein
MGRHLSAGRVGGRVECRREKELNDFQRIPLDIEILSNLRFGSLEIRDTSVTRVTNNFSSAPDLSLIFLESLEYLY